MQHKKASVLLPLVGANQINDPLGAERAMLNSRVANEPRRADISFQIINKSDEKE